ncbi:AIG2-like family protein [Botrimarina colliarenosi]|uniref:Gamma-glutamylcyclotransferase family protein n=1 Tax=Botrimarina colliarenosi TaxID=2528001 RepID=A0A5C6AK69_9BACT|nr:gamma-glutamylcyclotransferase family protein [Botrimarina colliarenosi]TWT99826.1 AIG2-like family protein [Botrimarina colliarenosi]
MSDACDHLFVYGTLKSGFDNAHAIALRHAATLVGPAVLCGRMYLVQGPRGSMRYPAVTEPLHDSDTVRGELYRLHDERVLSRLDLYEGCGPVSPTPHEYRRVVAEVVVNPTEAMLAYVYLYSGPTDGLRRLEKGVFPPVASSP